MNHTTASKLNNIKYQFYLLRDDIMMTYFFVITDSGSNISSSAHIYVNLPCFIRIYILLLLFRYTLRLYLHRTPLFRKTSVSPGHPDTSLQDHPDTQYATAILKVSTCPSNTNDSFQGHNVSVKHQRLFSN